jgi:hypothetical protein
MPRRPMSLSLTKIVSAGQTVWIAGAGCVAGGEISQDGANRAFREEPKSP